MRPIEGGYCLRFHLCAYLSIRERPDTLKDHPVGDRQHRQEIEKAGTVQSVRPSCIDQERSRRLPLIHGCLPSAFPPTGRGWKQSVSSTAIPPDTELAHSIMDRNSKAVGGSPSRHSLAPLLGQPALAGELLQRESPDRSSSRPSSPAKSSGKDGRGEVPI